MCTHHCMDALWRRYRETIGYCRIMLHCCGVATFTSYMSEWTSSKIHGTVTFLLPFATLLCLFALLPQALHLLSIHSSLLSLYLHDIFGSRTTYGRSTTYPKFDLTGARTHDLQIMTAHFLSLRRVHVLRLRHWDEYMYALHISSNCAMILNKTLLQIVGPLLTNSQTKIMLLTLTRVKHVRSFSKFKTYQGEHSTTVYTKFQVRRMHSKNNSLEKPLQQYFVQCNIICILYTVNARFKTRGLIIFMVHYNHPSSNWERVEIKT